MLKRKHDTFTYLDYCVQPAPEAPLLVMLHGYGSNEKDLISLAPGLDRRLQVISPQAPLHLGNEMYGWFPIEFTPQGITVDREAASRSRDLLAGFIRELIATYRPAGGKVFLMGFSQGAVMNYLTAFSTPELLHGVIALSGQLPDTRPEKASATEALKSLPFLVVHGLYDDVLAVEKGREAGNWLKANVADITYREYPMAHQIDDNAFAVVSAWLKEKIDLLDI